MEIYQWAAYYYEEAETANYNAYGLVAGKDYADALQRVIDTEFRGKNDIIESIKLYNWGSCVNAPKEAIKSFKESIIW